MTAVEDCLRGRDCVKIADGSFSLVAGGDGIRSNKDTEATQGFVSITGGTFSINAGDDAVQAKTYIGITGGTFSVTSADDAFHSDLQMAIAGGDFTVSAGDDAFHAETELAVDGGTIDVTSCCEGLEAEKVYVNGGDTSIVASDDAVNSSAADLLDSSDEDEDANDSGAPGEGGIAVNGEAPGKGGPAAGGSPADASNFPGGDQGGSNGRVSQGGAQGKGGKQPQNSAPQSESTQGDMPQGDQGGNQGGAPDAGSSDCLIQINGGTLVLDSAGDAIDSNGSVEITGGTVLMIGSSRMAQSFSSGTQPFLYTANVNGSAGDTVAIADANGSVIASITATKQFGMVLASSPKFTEGGEYTLVIGGMLASADVYGFTDSGTVSGGSSISATASTTPSSSSGGVGAGPFGEEVRVSIGGHARNRAFFIISGSERGKSGKATRSRYSLTWPYARMPFAWTRRRGVKIVSRGLRVDENRPISGRLGHSCGRPISALQRFTTVSAVCWILAYRRADTRRDGLALQSSLSPNMNSSQASIMPSYSAAVRVSFRDDACQTGLFFAPVLWWGHAIAAG